MAIASLVMVVAMCATLSAAQYLFTISNTVSSVISSSEEIVSGGFVRVALPCSSSATSDGCTYSISIKADDSIGTPSVIAAVLPSCGDYEAILYTGETIAQINQFAIPEDGDDGDYSQSYTVSPGNIAILYVQNDNSAEEIYFPTFQVSFSATVNAPDSQTAQAMENNMTAYLYPASADTVCSNYVTEINQVCVGDGNTLRQALPCPSTNTEPCAYRITVSAQPWISIEQLPDVDYYVYPQGQDYSNWNLGLLFSAIAFSVEPANAAFDSGWFAVPPGSTFIFQAYNDNFIENMYVNGAIVSFPNVYDPAANTQVQQGLSASASSYNLSGPEMFVTGFAITVYNMQPFQTPSQSCLSNITSLENYVEPIISLFQGLGSDTSTYPSTASQIVQYIHGAISLFTNAASACSCNCPGWAETEILDACSDVNELLEFISPQITAVEDTLELVVNGYDILQGIRNYMLATSSYERGASFGRIVAGVYHGYKDLPSLSRRGVQSPSSVEKRVTGARAHANIDLRHNDGKVRTIAEWQKLTQPLPRI